MDAVLLTILAIGLIVLVIGPSTTGYATGAQSQTRIEQMQLTTKEGIDDTLYVSTTVRANRDLVEFSIDLRINDIIVDSVNVVELADDKMTIAELSWKMKPGMHTVRVESLGSTAEKMIEVSQTGVIFKVTELEVGAGEETQHFLDFTRGGVEYEVRAEEGDSLKLAFEDQTKLIDLSEFTETSIKADMQLISIGADAIFDLNEDGEDDVKIRLNSLDGKEARLTVSSLEEPSLLSRLLSVWWLILIVIVIVIAVFLAGKTELLRTKHGRGVLKRVKEARKEGVISESLYKKTTRTIRRKLKP